MRGPYIGLITPLRTFVSTEESQLRCENGDKCGYCHLPHVKRPMLPDRRKLGTHEFLLSG